MAIGIISAMPEEIISLLEVMEVKSIQIKGMRKYHIGELYGKRAVLVFSRWGKVAAATSATQLIEDFEISEIIFTGVAGAISDELMIGDVVIGDKLYQHDLDGSPIVERFEIPLLGRSFFETHISSRDKLNLAAEYFFDNYENYISEEDKNQFSIERPKVLLGDIASGDQFISNPKQVAKIKKNLPNIVCVEMEGAAVAQVCFEYQIPFSIIRTISDRANDNAHIDFPVFAKNIASKYALAILRNYLMRIN